MQRATSTRPTTRQRSGTISTEDGALALLRQTLRACAEGPRTNGIDNRGLIEGYGQLGTGRDGPRSSISPRS